MNFNTLYKNTITFLTESKIYPLPEDINDHKRLMYGVTVSYAGKICNIFRVTHNMGIWEVFDSTNNNPYTSQLTLLPVTYETARLTVIRWFNQNYTNRIYRHDEYQPDTYGTDAVHEKAVTINKINEALKPLQDVAGQWKVLCIHDGVDTAVVVLDVDIAAHKSQIAGKALQSLKNNSLVNKLFSTRV